MIFIDKYDISFWPKAVFSSCVLCVLMLSLYLLLAGEMTASTWLRPYLLSGDLVRRVMFAGCLILYFIRLQVTVWVFEKRKFTWREMMTISILMPFVVWAYARAGGSGYQTVGPVAIAGLLVYLAGSYINTRSEYLRLVWKSKQENKGRLYTEGLFRHSMHINYFGDIVLFTGLSIMTQQISMLVIPLVMGLNFVFFIIPRLDQYLELKYADEFREYSKKTKKLIPMVY